MLSALVGHTAYVEGCATGVQGTVSRVEGGRLIVTCGPETKEWPESERLEVTISVFGPDALYRLEGGAEAFGRDVVLDGGALVERIQRRHWPRRRMDIPATLCAVGDGRRIEGVPGRTVDLGVGGVSVETLRPIDCESRTRIILSLPDGTSFVAAARTVSSEELGDGWRYRFAFEHLDAHDAARLTALTTD